MSPPSRMYGEIFTTFFCHTAMFFYASSKIYMHVCAAMRHFHICIVFSKHVEERKKRIEYVTPVEERED